MIFGFIVGVVIIIGLLFEVRKRGITITSLKTKLATYETEVVTDVKDEVSKAESAVAADIKKVV